MSIRVAAPDQHLILTSGIPTSSTSFTIAGFAKLQTAHPTYYGVLAALLSSGDSRVHQAVVYNPSTGLDLYASNDYDTTVSAVAGTLSAGAASGSGWFFFALIGSASGAGGLRIVYRPVGGSLSYQDTDNSGWSGAAIAALRLGRNTLAAPSFGNDEYLFDGFYAHVKRWDVALSLSEITAESLYAAPVRTSNLLGYTKMESLTLATALAPDQGTGTFTYTSAPSTSSDMPPVAASPGALVSWAEMDVPAATVTVEASSVATRAAVGSPDVSSVGGGSPVRVSWAEMDVPSNMTGASLTGVASRAAIGVPTAASTVQANPTGVASRAAVGTPSAGTGGFVQATGVASASAVGTPAASARGEINGNSEVALDQAVTASPFGVQTRRAVGTPSATYVGSMAPSGVASRAAVGTPSVTSGAFVSLESYGVLSRRAVGTPSVSSTVAPVTVQATGVVSRADVGSPTVGSSNTTADVYPIGRTSMRAVGTPGVVSVDANGIILQPEQAGGGPDADDDEVGPHKAPKHMRAHAKKREQKKVEEAAKEVAEQTEPTKQITAETPPFRKVDGGILVTPEMLQAIKDEAMRAARLQMEVRGMKESKIVAAAREIGEQKASARLARLADLAIQAAEEAEYEPAEREQVKTIELEDPVTGQPIKATITSKVPA